MRMTGYVGTSYLCFTVSISILFFLFFFRVCVCVCSHWVGGGPYGEP